MQNNFLPAFLRHKYFQALVSLKAAAEEVPHGIQVFPLGLDMCFFCRVYTCDLPEHPQADEHHCQDGVANWRKHLLGRHKLGEKCLSSLSFGAMSECLILVAS